MSNRFAVAALLAAAVVFGQETRLTPPAAAEHPILAIGSPAPDFALPGVDDKIHKLSDYKESPLLVVMFLCNHCPTSQLYEGRVKKLVEDYGSRGVAFVAIHPNDPKAVLLSELGYTDVSDSLEEMKIRAAYAHFNFPYLFDGETQAAAQAPAFGCSTKWKSKIDGQLKEAQRIEAEPVKLEMATVEDLKRLRMNPTGKVLLVNFWVTWCGPCLTEFPEIENTYRMYRRRDFDLVGVPFTMVIAPGGKVLYQKQGEVDVLAMRRAILANLENETYVGHPAYWAAK